MVALAREHGWVSDAHFTVDGTLIEAWASRKRFQSKTGAQAPRDGAPGNSSVDFHGERRSNPTHESTTDAEARLLRKGKEARLCFGLHALRENRHGLCVQAQVTSATGVTEPAVPTELLARQVDQAEHPPQTVGADKGYHNAELVSFCREHGIAPHVAQIKDRKVKGLDGRTTRTLGYQTSQKVRKRIEEICGWCKEMGGLRRTRKRGVDRVGLSAILILSSYNLVRMAKLLGSPRRTTMLATA
ncbi:MAG: transposase, is4 family [Verrucomicrobiota bacterium]